MYLSEKQAGYFIPYGFGHGFASLKETPNFICKKEYITRNMNMELIFFLSIFNGDRRAYSFKRFRVT